MKRSVLLLLMFFLNLAACSEQKQMDSDRSAEVIPLCPASPNCVSSDASDNEHQISPYSLAKPADKVWPDVQQAILQLPRCKIVRQTQYFLHAECRSAFFGFIDDLKLELRTEQKMIAVYSASRLGYSDFGVNRKRIESLRTALIKRGQIE